MPIAKTPATADRQRRATQHELGRRGANEEDVGGRPAFLYKSGSYRAATLDANGSNLPAVDTNEPWTMEREFTLGIRDVGLRNVSPEQMVRGVYAAGYFMWRIDEPASGSGSSQ